MKKFTYCFLIIAICFASLGFLGCNNNQVIANFVRFNIGQRQNDYYLDFTIEFKNNTNNLELINENDFYIEINTEEKKDIAYLYENEEVYYPAPSINKNETMTIRIRVITEINNKAYNTITFKYKDKTLVDDNVYISNNKKLGV